MFYVPFLLNSTIDWSWSLTDRSSNPFIHSPNRQKRDDAAWSYQSVEQHRRGGAAAMPALCLQPNHLPHHSAPRSRYTYGEANEDSHCQIVLCSTVDFCNFWYMPFYHHVKAMPSSTASLDLVVFLPVTLLWFFYIVNEETKKYTTIKNFYALQPNEFPTFAFHHIA